MMRVAIVFAVLIPVAAWAAPVPVRHTEGLLHGFLAIRTLEGEVIGGGELSQSARGDRVTARLVLRFRDGSLHEEKVVYSQRGVLRLLRDDLSQKGPSFPHPMDMRLDAAAGTIDVKRVGDDGKETTVHERMAFPADLANGLVTTILKNVPADTAGITLPLVVAAPKPHMADLTIVRDGAGSFSVAGSRREAARFTVRVKIRGGAGVVAKLLDKQPPDYHVWILTGETPVFLRSEGPLYNGGPVWHIELTSPVWR